MLLIKSFTQASQKKLREHALIYINSDKMINAYDYAL